MNKKEKIEKQIEATEENIKYFKSRVKDKEDLKSGLEAKLEELKQEEQEWKPDLGEIYWFVDLDIMKVINANWSNHKYDNIRLQHKVIFKTEKEAEEYLEYLQAKEKAMNEFSNAEWEDEDINKYYIYYDCEDNFFRADYSYYCRRINEMYFRTKESAQEFINKYEKYLRRELKI